MYFMQFMNNSEDLIRKFDPRRSYILFRIQIKIGLAIYT